MTPIQPALTVIKVDWNIFVAIIRTETLFSKLNNVVFFSSSSLCTDWDNLCTPFWKLYVTGKNSLKIVSCFRHLLHDLDTISNWTETISTWFWSIVSELLTIWKWKSTFSSISCVKYCNIEFFWSIFDWILSHYCQKASYQSSFVSDKISFHN